MGALLSRTPWHTALKALQTSLTRQAESGSSAQASVAAAAAGTAGRARETKGLDGEYLHMVTGIQPYCY